MSEIWEYHFPQYYILLGKMYRAEAGIHPQFEQKFQVGNPVVFYGFTSKYSTHSLVRLVLVLDFSWKLLMEHMKLASFAVMKKRKCC